MVSHPTIKLELCKAAKKFKSLSLNRLFQVGPEVVMTVGNEGANVVA